MAARGTDAVEVTDFAAPIDLLRRIENSEQRDIERLEVITATAGATITCRTKKSGDADRIYNVAQGDKLELQIRSIRSVTNISRVRVVWGDF